MPEQYLEDFWDRRGGFRDTAQLFRVEITSWEPVTREETGERNAKGIWNWMDFVVGDHDPLPELAALRADLFGDPRPPVTAYDQRSGPYGLAWLDMPNSSLTETPQEDGFVFPPDLAALETVIECSSPHDPLVRHPVCSQAFRAGDVDVWLDYRQTELSRSRDLQAQVRAFVTCARSEAS